MKVPLVFWRLSWLLSRLSDNVLWVLRRFVVRAVAANVMRGRIRRRTYPTRDDARRVYRAVLKPEAQAPV